VIDFLICFLKSNEKIVCILEFRENFKPTSPVVTNLNEQHQQNIRELYSHNKNNLSQKNDLSQRIRNKLELKNGVLDWRPRQVTSTKKARIHAPL